MKFNRNARYTTISIYALIVLVAAMVIYQALQNIGILFGVLSQITGFVMPIIYGVVFAFLLNPMLRAYDDRLLARIMGDRISRPARRGIAILLTYLSAVLMIVLFVSIVLPQIIASLMNIFSNIPAYVKSLTTLYDSIIVWLDGFLIANDAGDFSQLADELAYHAINSLRTLLSSLITVLEQSITLLVSLTTSFTTGVINLILGIIVSIYILNDRERLFAQLKKIGCALFPESVYRLLCDIAMDINRIFSGFVIGKVIDSIIIGILCMIGMSILRMPYAALVSVIIGVTNVIPYFGPFIGAIPGFVIIFIASPIQSFWFLVFVLLLQQLDGNVIGPKILGDTVGLSPLWIIFSIMLFSGLMGVLGMFIGVPLFALIYTLAKRFIAFLLERKGHPSDTKNFASEENPLLK